MNFNREDGTLGVQADPQSGTFTVFDDTGVTAVARFGELLETAPTEYGVEVLVGSTWVRLGNQTTTWDSVSGKPTDFAPLVTSAVANATNAVNATNATTAAEADGVTDAAYARDVGGIIGNRLAMWMHENGQIGYNTSALRYKRNVRDFTLTIEQLMGLRAVLYDRKANNADDYTPPVSVDELGLIAEETQAAVPQLAIEMNGQVESVLYERLGVAVLPIIQDLVRRVEALEAGSGS
jgi:hypothetical protein